MLAIENKQVIAITCKTIVGTITILLNRKIHFQRLSLNANKTADNSSIFQKAPFSRKGEKTITRTIPNSVVRKIYN